MKKVISLSLGLMIVCSQSLHAIQESRNVTAADVADDIYWVLKSTGQGAWWALGQVASVGANVGSKVANGLGLPDLANKTTEAVNGMTKKTTDAAGSVAQKSVDVAQKSMNVAQKALIKTGYAAAAIGATVGSVYAAYWLYGAKSRQELKELKNKLAPEIPTVKAGYKSKARYRIFNWKLAEYETAGQLVKVRESPQSFTKFINELAEDVINGEFKDIDPYVCLDSQGRPLMSRDGRKLTQEAALQILQHIEKEKPILEHVLDALKGDRSLAQVEEELAGLMSANAMNPNNLGPIARIAPEVGQHKSYISGKGLPIKKWTGLEYLFGLKGNNFTFSYAEEYKQACKLAGFKNGVTPKPADMTPDQYAIVDGYMKRRATTAENKFKYFKGHVNFAQASRLYWNTYKQIHRLEVIASMLNAAMHDLPVNGRPKTTVEQIGQYGYQGYIVSQEPYKPLYPKINS